MVSEFLDYFLGRERKSKVSACFFKSLLISKKILPETLFKKLVSAYRKPPVTLRIYMKPPEILRIMYSCILEKIAQ
jgi:hypothetical protein